VAAWYWVASGKVDFVPHEKMLNHLNENGIEFVGRRLTAKHLALVAKQGKSSPGRRRRSRK
jgi:hypothetical protein